MKKINCYIIMLSAVFALGLVSCVDVDKLSDSNKVSSFEISSVSPSQIRTGAAEIGDNEIVIPIKYGADKFPLTIGVSVRFESQIDEVRGEDLSSHLVFDTIDDQKVFYVMAESGLSRKYTISFREEEFIKDDELPFTLLSVVPVGSRIYGNAQLKDDKLLVYVVEPEFPLAIIPRFEEDKYTFDNFDNGSTAFLFKDAQDMKSIGITQRETGIKKDIELMVSAVSLVAGNEGAGETTDIFNSDLKLSAAGQSAGFGLKGFRIDHEADIISVFVEKLSADAQFPFTMKADISSYDANTGFIDLVSGQEITFSDFSARYGFIKIDAAGDVAREWSFRLEEYREPAAADVLSFEYEYNESYNIIAAGFKIKKPLIFDKEAIDIYPDRGEIWLKAVEINEAFASANWKIELSDIEIILSEGATVDLPGFLWQGNGSWQTPKSFNVVSSEGDVKEWTLNIRDFSSGTPSSQAGINGVAIHSIFPLMATADPLQPVSMDHDQKTIFIRLAEDEDSYPMEVRLDYSLPDFALVTSQNNNTEPMVFNSAESVNEVVVTAEDGTTTDTWTVKLIQPERQVAANVTVFRIDSFSSPVSNVYSTRIDTETGEIILVLNRAGSFPATMNYSMALSRNAEADVPLSGSFAFTDLNDTAEFTVTSSSGSKDWTVKFAAYTPQIENWRLDDWADDNTLTPVGRKGSPYWATANNAIIKGTDKAAGVSGWAARLSTKQAPVVNRLASGSLLLGWFDADNATGGLSDPVKLIYQGIEWAATKKIVALEVDINYSSGGDGSDTGSVAIEFIKQSPYDPATYIFHGNRPDGTVHPENTASGVARGQAIIGNKSSAKVTDVLPDGVWRTVRVNVDYGSHNPLDYTHMVVICASSSEGDSFIGSVGTVMLIDNVKLIYED